MARVQTNQNKVHPAEILKTQLALVKQRFIQSLAECVFKLFTGSTSIHMPDVY